MVDIVGDDGADEIAVETVGRSEVVDDGTSASRRVDDVHASAPRADVEESALVDRHAGNGIVAQTVGS